MDLRPEVMAAAAETFTSSPRLTLPPCRLFRRAFLHKQVSTAKALG